MREDYSAETMRRLRALLRTGDEEELEGGRYRKVEMLGEGGMGEVWKAWDAKLGRWVALKFLKGGGELNRARFRREGLTAAKLAHPNIVPIHEVTDEFLCMEFVEGRTADDLELDVRRATEVVRDVARAVAYAHEQGIIHRDLKPQNVIVDARGHPWVTDFGLARPLEGGSTVTSTGAVVGTPAYMAPEQADGSRVDGRSDVYSLGATLYELIAGRPPFLGATFLEVAHRVRTEDAPPLRRFRPDVPSDLEIIVRKAMEKEPARRYATPGELAEDLDRRLAGAPILAQPPSLLRGIGRLLRNRRLALVIGALSMLPVVATAVAGGTRYAEARRLGKAGVVAAREGRLDEAKRALERSTALWSIGEYRRELKQVSREIERRRRANRLGILYQETFRRLREDALRAEEAWHGATTPSKKEAEAILDRVGAAIARIEPPFRDSSLPPAVRGWFLCNLGRIEEGESELERAFHAGGRSGGDPFGAIFRLRWRVRKFYVRRGNGALPPPLLGELQHLAERLRRPERQARPPQPHAGSSLRHLILALAASARGDRTEEAARLAELEGETSLREEASLFAASVRIGAGERSGARPLLEEAARLRPNCPLARGWLERIKGE